jgi:hypothetical protein
MTLRTHGTTHYPSIWKLMTRRINFSSRHRKESKNVVIFSLCSEVLYGFGRQCWRNGIVMDCSSFLISITFSEEHVSLVFLIFQRGNLLPNESSVIDKSFNNDRESINSSTNNFVKILSKIPLFRFGQRTPNPIKYSLRTKCTPRVKKYLTIWCSLVKIKTKYTLTYQWNIIPLKHQIIHMSDSSL